MLLNAIEQERAHTLNDRFVVFTRFCAAMRDLGTANFLYFDGEVLFVHADRRVFETATGLTAPRESGLVMRHFASEPSAQDSWQSTGAQIASLHPQTVLVASVPLNDQGWDPLPRGTTVALHQGAIVARLQL